MIKISACRFCGQILTTEGEFATQKEADEEALRCCSCPDAREWQKRVASLNSGLEKIEELFGETSGEYGFIPMDEGIVNSLKSNLHLCFEGVYRKITVTLKDGSTAELKFTDTAEVSRKKTSKVKLQGG